MIGHALLRFDTLGQHFERLSMHNLVAQEMGRKTNQDVESRRAKQ